MKPKRKVSLRETALGHKYLNHTHISEVDFRHILEEFARDSTATETSERVKISRPTVTRIYQLLRKRIFLLAQKESCKMYGDIEIDESYFGPKRVRGKRGRGAGNKIPVFGMLIRDGEVYTQIVKKCSKAQLLPILKGKVLNGSTIYSDGWKAYDSLIYNYDHYRVYHSKNEFARGKNYINGTESFWSWSKRRIQKFNGTHRRYFYLHLTECEWRFNHRHDNIYTILLKEVRRNPLKKTKNLLFKVK